MPVDHSQKAQDGIMYFLGVTGFDGLYLERRATQCTLAYHLNLARKHTCKEHSRKREVSVLRCKGLLVRFRDCLTALAKRRLPSRVSTAEGVGGILCGIALRSPARQS